MSSLGIFPPNFLRWSFSLGAAAAKTLLTTPQSISMTGVCHHTPPPFNVASEDRTPKSSYLRGKCFTNVPSPCTTSSCL